MLPGHKKFFLMNEMKSYFNDIVKNAIETVIMIDTNRKIKMIDGNLFGYEEEDILGKSVDLLFESKEFYEPLFKKDIIQDSNTSCTTKGGKRIPVSFSSVALRDKRAKVIGVMSIVRNISEMERLERELIQSEKMASIGQFSAGIAHQLNTPLGTILMYTQMLIADMKKHTLGNQKLLKRLTVMEQQGKRAKQLIQRLLTFSRPRKAEFAPVDINQVVENSLLMVEEELAQSNIKVLKNLEPCPEIMGDAHQLQELVINMIMNTRQSMPKSGTLTLSTIPMQRFVKIKFQDTGEGIPEENINRIFEPFFTDKAEGTGLGLFICRNVVYNHNGFIDVQSEVGKGATFTISLPITLTASF